VDWEGEPLVRLLAERIKGLAKRVMVVTDDPLRFAFLDIAAVRDIEPGLGPLGGLMTALYHSTSDMVFLRGCDMPFISSDLVRHMMARAAGKAALVPEVFGRLQPLCAIYSRDTINEVERMVKEGDMAITRVAGRVKGTVLREEEAREHDPELISFLSFNTEKELEALKMRYGSKG
jgi:molybdopterin-guanine dinucleotide biosynthesis protein A